MKSTFQTLKNKKTQILILVVVLAALIGMLDLFQKTKGFQLSKMIQDIRPLIDTGEEPQRGIAGEKTP